MASAGQGALAQMYAKPGMGLPGAGQVQGQSDFSAQPAPEQPAAIAPVATQGAPTASNPTTQLAFDSSGNTYPEFVYPGSSMVAIPGAKDAQGNPMYAISTPQGTFYGSNQTNTALDQKVTDNSVSLPGGGTLDPDGSINLPGGSQSMQVTPGGVVNSNMSGAGGNTDLGTPGNTTAGGQTAVASTPGTGQGGPNANNNSNNPSSPGANDPCSTSMKIANGSGQFACAGTDTLIKTTQITSIVGQVGGSAAVNTMGNSQQQQLMMNGATQAQAMQSAASLQMKAAGIQTALGATQLVMGIMENNKGGQHQKNANALNNAATQSSYIYSPGATNPISGATTQVQYANKNAVGDQYVRNALSQQDGIQQGAMLTAATAATANQASNQAYNEGVKAKSEQNSMASAAKAAGFNDIIRGAATTAQGLMAIAAAKEQEKLANELANLPSGAVLPGGADNFNPTAQAPNAPTIITGNGSSPGPAPSLAAAVAGPGGTLGTGAGVPAGDGLNNPGPTPDAFVAGNGTSQGGGVGGGGLGGSTGTSASPPGSAEDPSAKYANGNTAAAYQGGGSVMGGGSGGSRGGANGDPSISLKDAFAQLLGQNGEAKKDEPGSDIMNFRKLASDAPFAPLPAGEDFFKYIHQAYEGLQKKGRVGL